MPRLELHENLLSLSCDFDDREKAKVITGFRWNKELKMWQYPIDLEVYLQIKQVFPSAEIAGSVHEIFNAHQEAVQAGTSFKKNPVVHPTINSLNVKTLPRNHQVVGVSFLLNQNSAMLCDEMGLGKTFQAMMAAIGRKQMGKVSRVLVLCPATLKGTWAAEIDKHTNEKFVVLDGGRKQRNEQFKTFLSDQACMFLIVNFESFRIDALKFNFDMIIID